MYRVISGDFVIRYPDRPTSGQPQPDGDTIKFAPADRSLVEGLPRFGTTPPDVTATGLVNVRFEAIDALETHYGAGGDSHQRLDLARAARDRLLAFLGFTNVVFDAAEPNVVASADALRLPGHVLGGGIDENGRVIGFVFAGAAALVDGAEVFLTADLVRTSANATLCAEGLAYPLFYTTMPKDLRVPFTEVALAARADGLGLWPSAAGDPHAAAVIGGVDDLLESVIWPKLFRRLSSYFGTGATDLSGFEAWLRADAQRRDDRMMVLSSGELLRLHNVARVSADGTRIGLTTWPEDLLVLPAAVAPVPAPPSTGVPRPRPSGVVIVAAVVNPSGTDAGRETVTLLNPTPAAVDLTGWSVTDAAGRRSQALTGTLGSGEALRVVLRSVQLGNDGDTVVLRDAAGATVTQASYRAADAAREGWTVLF